MSILCLLNSAKSSSLTPLKIDIEGVPLKTSLRLCLEQLDLTYDVHDGLLFIASTERQDALSRQIPPPLDHSYLVAGHCVLALIAAVIGGILAPVVSDWRHLRQARRS